MNLLAKANENKSLLEPAIIGSRDAIPLHRVSTSNTQPLIRTGSSTRKRRKEYVFGGH